MPPSPSDLAARLPALMLRDRERMLRRLQRARRLPAARRPAEFERIEAAIGAAEERVERRRRGVPVPRYPDGLPIVERREDLLDAIRDHQVVVVAGETGSGKSTQLPKMCLELGRGVLGFIGHTQPRRIAARTIAERIAEELGGEVGGAVGYAVRFTDRVGEDTLVKVMTDGILLAEVQRDRMLTAYDVIILDEAHERSLNIDFLLGYLKQLLPRRPDLKLVITSATIDTERFSQHFGDAPIVEVSGRSYPVEMRYRPIGEEAADDRDQTQAICDAVEELAEEGPGDILVFLSGEREIRDTADAITRLDLPHTDVLPLYARLSAADQHRVFSSHSGRRIVLATNVAETSLTVPGIRSVIDPGTARISRYNRRTKVQRLPIEAISRASANQRAGRCGRVAPGTCIRLYAEADFETRPAFTEPEILRTNLASVILQMAALGLGDVAAFPFVDPPDARNIKDGIALLEELGALAGEAGDTAGRLTPIGRRLAQLPVDPRLGRMVLEAERNGCVREVLVIAAALAIQDPRERPTGKEQAAAESHRRFADPESDFVAYLNLWRHIRDRQRELTSNQFRKLCKAEFLNYLRVREWQDVHSQLRGVVKTMGIERQREDEDHGYDRDAVHLSLLAGLLSHIGTWDPVKQDYTGARGARFAIAPGSTLAKKRPRWVVAAELVETNRLWARTVARIRPERIEALADHLVTRSYGEPWWDVDQGAAIAQERVSLYGLVIVSARRTHYAKVDPAAARDLFIQHALVEGEWSAHHDFLRHNEALVEEVRALEDRGRRRDILVGDDVLFDFFDRLLPTDITSTRHFDKWWKDERRRHPDLLSFTLDLLIDAGAGKVSGEDFPDVWRQGRLTLDLTYVLDPASPLDGVTVDIPRSILAEVDAGRLGWQVPGLREELLTTLIRSLPKHLRRRFVPVPDVVGALGSRVTPDDGPLLDVLDRELGRIGGESIPAGTWDLESLPEHLRMTFRVLDEEGEVVASGKDLVALQAMFAHEARLTEVAAAPSIEVEGLRSWTFGDLPRAVELLRSGQVVEGFPALIDETHSVAVRVLGSVAEQERAMRTGTRRMLLLTLPAPATLLRSAMTTATVSTLAMAEGAAAGEILEDCVAAAVDHLVADCGGPVWDSTSYAALAVAVEASVMAVAGQALAVVIEILGAAGDVRAHLALLRELGGDTALEPALDDATFHLARLVHTGFVTSTGTARLPAVIRYLRAIEHRLDTLGRAATRDRQLQRQVHQLEEQFERLARFDDDGNVRWMLEELRVSLFAPSLGTPTSVSEQSVRRALDRLVPGRRPRDAATIA